MVQGQAAAVKRSRPAQAGRLGAYAAAAGLLRVPGWRKPWVIRGVHSRPPSSVEHSVISQVLGQHLGLAAVPLRPRVATAADRLHAGASGAGRRGRQSGTCKAAALGSSSSSSSSSSSGSTTRPPAAHAVAAAHLLLLLLLLLLPVVRSLLSLRLLYPHAAAALAALALPRLVLRDWVWNRGCRRGCRSCRRCVAACSAWHEELQGGARMRRALTRHAAQSQQALAAHGAQQAGQQLQRPRHPPPAAKGARPARACGSSCGAAWPFMGANGGSAPPPASAADRSYPPGKPATEAMEACSCRLSACAGGGPQGA